MEGFGSPRALEFKPVIPILVLAHRRIGWATLCPPNQTARLDWRAAVNPRPRRASRRFFSALGSNLLHQEPGDVVHREMRVPMIAETVVDKTQVRVPIEHFAREIPLE